MNVFDLAAANLVSPVVLFFALGLLAALARSELSIPESVAKATALYLMLSIGFKGGVEVARSGLDGRLVATLLVGALLSAVLPVIGFALLRWMSGLSRVDAAAVAAHYGSISIVTFVAATQALAIAGMPFEGWMVAVAAAMETPAILSALWLARRKGEGEGRTDPRARVEPGQQVEPLGPLLREIGLNASVVMLVGSFFIGWATGERGLNQISAFIVSPFQGVLCLFLLDMGLVAGRGLREGRKHLEPAVVGFGVAMPLISATLAALVAWPLGLSVGGTFLLLTLAASASYIAVPAAMRLALPEARPAIYLTLSLGVTFPFNLTVGIPLYLTIAGLLARP